MTREEKIKVLAELDGCQCKVCNCGCGATYWQHPKIYKFDARTYLTSYDAIIPLIQRQLHEVRIEMEELLVSRYWCAAVQHTAEELADALIKAVGKWRE